jgi:hypothetical protein
MSPAFLLIGVLLILVLLGWLATLVVVLVNRKTRTLGLVVLAAPIIPLVGVSLIAWWWIHPSHATWRPQPPVAVHNLSEHRSPSPPAPLPQAGEGSVGAPAKTRPAWVDTPSGLGGDVYQMSIMVGPFTTRQECDARVDEELQKALDRYVEICLGRPPAERIVLPAELLRQQLIKEKWEEVGQYSVGPMTQLHLLLKFDRRLKDRVLEEHQRGIIAERLWYAGAGLAAVLAALTGAYGYLKITGRRRMTKLE